MTTIHLLGVRVFVGHSFGCLSPLPSYIGFIYRGNTKICDNMDNMYFFDALNLVSIHREKNSMADQLAVATSTLQLSQERLDGDDKLEINFRPLVPYNMKHWQVFWDDEQILRFIHNVKEFSNFSVNHRE